MNICIFIVNFINLTVYIIKLVDVIVQIRLVRSINPDRKMLPDVIATSAIYRLDKFICIYPYYICIYMCMHIADILENEKIREGVAA